MILVPVVVVCVLTVVTWLLLFHGARTNRAIRKEFELLRDAASETVSDNERLNRNHVALLKAADARLSVGKDDFAQAVKAMLVASLAGGAIQVDVTDPGMN